MLDSDPKQHNSKNNARDFLTPLQKKILLCLAKTLPQTINEAVKATNGNYRSSWAALKQLEKKNLIANIGTKKYRGRDYPRFWATENGILYAYSQGAKPELLLRKAQEYYPEKKDLHWLLEALPILGTENINEMIYQALITDGKISSGELISIFSKQKKLNDLDIKKYHSILKKYPERQEQHKKALKEFSKNLKDLMDEFGI